ncbi:protein-tyrosine-phosphatase [Kocuria dechangensis]|uniref:Protein-tyrosine-phosphatase n=1 Tax=Kocuria dechangensis TaxID=1176249 RepID=A0A917GJJ1_9MICC|nr:tyrosine-protein phosphatase [Kocuria dechangensis]GGG48729.1 protein-tyrosine-phosphatase [Kocuria dechangensis]
MEPTPGDPVAWDGAINARRLAGDVYRMGRSERLTAAGWRAAAAAGVRTVVDLRNADERRRRPTDPVDEPSARTGITVLHRPTEDPSHPEFPLVGTPYLNHPRGYRDYLRLFPDLVAEAVRAVATAEGGVVVHCSAGRDRTGVLALLLLRLAGADAARVVAQDEAAARGINEWHRVSPVPHPVERHHGEDELARLLAGRRAALLELAAGFDAVAYLRAAGLTDRELSALRRRLSGPAGP